MAYERSRQIEERFNRTIDLIQQRFINANLLAAELCISRTTAQRIISTLKKRGYPIRSVRDDDGWHYEIKDTLSNVGEPKVL